MFEISGSFLLRTRCVVCRACKRFWNIVLTWTLEKCVSPCYVPTNAKIRSTTFLELLLFVMLQTNVFVSKAIFTASQCWMSIIVAFKDDHRVWHSWNWNGFFYCGSNASDQWGISSNNLSRDGNRAKFPFSILYIHSGQFFMYNNKCL